MADYRLDRLNTREFEHLTQGLCKQFIAIGVTPFGDGPDGGREATFHGEMNYPANAAQWNGYLVVQCKFRQRSNKESDSDSEWAINELKAELSKYKPSVGTVGAPKNSRHVPDYFLYVTNAVLTATQDSGGKDRCIALLKQEAQRLGLSGYDVWGFDDLCRYLDLSPELRQTYSGFILPDDVLHRAIQNLEIHQPNFEDVLSRFLQKELKNDSAAKLQSAGQHDLKNDVPLSSVFHDIPFDFSKNSTLEPSDNHAEVVRYLIEKGDQVISYGVNDSAELIKKQKLEKGRYILVGGPGQGKSTVGQYICQLYRAAILQDVSQDLLDEGARYVLAGVVNSTVNSNISLPACRRFPFRLVLNSFATDLANESNLSIVEYISRRLARLGSVNEISLQELNKWIANYPWIFIFDGLDEVPSSSNRSEVVAAIQDFLVDLSSRKADVIVIATTRPQGYSDDLAKDFFQHMYLAPLSEKK